MIEELRLVLRILLIALVLFPVVGVLCSALINVYFNRLEKHAIRMALRNMGINPDSKEERKDG